MNILVTGVSGIGKTTLLNKVREDFSREEVVITDCDNIGYRDSNQNWNISEKAVVGLINQNLKDLILFGVSDNINKIARHFDYVIVMTGPVSDDHIQAVKDREAERSKRKGYVANPDNLNKKLGALNNAYKELDKVLHLVKTTKLSNDDSYKMLQKLARNAKIGYNSNK